ncbi:hypothetical protein SARC_02517 [Sphaeroforma arctica JP610]|uniref:Uncharacterized protein n=1 Tax=Sphaeroforma arctica JP610 TaxID=667725 RepID=A0A0L0G8Q4_9EUKA|nr:hypothetical protein SARC_02517 [Sphaeroforma arctica JP610]KNC85294.1 hypothetical protein SARC_02517 [Sphaeroforma arctica JP610]|eukprot:XP_014159196.1 hypothetical protein SARC_02517 [Sphaeroforma arctica JP610]
MRTHRLIALDDHCIGTQQPQELTDSVFLDHLRAGGGACVTGDYGVTIRLPSLMERLETYVSTRIDQHRDLAPLIALSWLIKGLLNTHLTSDTDKLRCSVMLKQLTDKTLTNTEPTSGSPAAVTMPFGHASESISAHNTTQSSETVPIQVRNTHSREPCTQEALGRSYEALDEALRLTNQVLSHPDTRDVSANDMGRHRLLKKHSTLVRRYGV